MAINKYNNYNDQDRSSETVAQHSVSAYSYSEFQVQKEFLDLSYKNLELIPPQLFEKMSSGIRNINLQNNRLTIFPESLVGIRGLQILRLDSNYINRIPETIGHLQNLQHFSISANILHSIPGSIRKLQSLVSLNLSYNNMDEFP